MIKVTNKAILHLKEVLHRQNAANYAIRVGVRGKEGCHQEYYLGLQKKPLPGDTVFTVNGLTFLMDGWSTLKMREIQLDFNDELRRSFIFISYSDEVEKECGTCHLQI